MRLPILEVLDRNFSSRTQSYEQLALEKDKCNACGVRKHYNLAPVQSDGSANAPSIMFCGEAPGNDEAEQGRPFIGQAGERIRKELRKYPHVFNRKTTIISNVLGCRPLNNKFPSADEPKTCFDLWLDREIKLLQPKIIVCLGNVPLKYVKNQTGITRKRGEWDYLENYKAWGFATYHPSYVIRSERSKNIEVVNMFEKDIADLAKECETRLGISK